MFMEAPFFLVALPQLQDENFFRSVVLIGQHDDQGAFGLLLNKPMIDENLEMTQMVTEVKDPLGNTLSEFQEDIFEGGPVNEGAIYALHDIIELGTEETAVGENVFLATDPELFQKLLENGELKNRRRFFVGCSAWSEGQLETEIRTGAWMLVPFAHKFLFEGIEKEKMAQWQEDLWKRVLVHGGADPLTLMAQGSTDSGYN